MVPLFLFIRLFIVMEKEIWKQIKDTEYFVSNLGNVKNKYDKLMKTRINSHGYHIINIRIGTNKPKTIAIHRLVAQAFISNPTGSNVVNHKDGNKLNNVVDNLEWVNVPENTRHYLSYYNVMLDFMNELCPCCIDKWKEKSKQFADEGVYKKERA